MSSDESMEGPSGVCKGHASSRWCDTAGALYTCSADEKILSQVACGSPSLCEPGLVTGECAACVPNAVRCRDQRVERCGSAGAGFDLVSLCALPDVCDASGAACKAASELPNQLTLDTWAKQQGLYWEGQVWLAADATGDGRSDLVNVFGDSDGLVHLDVHAAGSDLFDIEMWVARLGQWQASQFWAAGDFNGDGKADVAQIWNDDGSASIEVYISTGTTFNLETWATDAGGIWDGQVWLAGDFNGDGNSDLAVIFAEQDGVSIDVHESDGKGFSSNHWLVSDDTYVVGSQWAAGDFNGDMRTDIARVFGQSGKIVVDAYLSNATGFARERWVTREGSYWDGQIWLAEDFTGDGLCDLGNVYGDGNYASIDVRPSLGDRFGLERWTNRLGSFAAGQLWRAGRFNGNAKADFAVVYGDNGMITIEVQLH